MRPDLRRVVAVLALLALASCAPTLDLAVERAPSHALASQADTPLRAQLAPHIPAEQSGFHLLADGRAALAARPGWRWRRAPSARWTCSTTCSTTTRAENGSPPRCWRPPTAACACAC